MPSKVEITFVGICVYMRSKNLPLPTVVGLLDERSHVHLVSYRDASGNMVTKGLKAGIYTPKNVDSGSTTLVDPDNRLPDLVSLAGGSPGANLNQVFRVQIVLPAGTLTTLPAVQELAGGPWRFDTNPPRDDQNLTDRCLFTVETTGDAKSVMFAGDTEMFPDPDGVIRAQVMAIDQTAGNKRTKLEFGLQLCEFQLLYDCVDRLGPVPVFTGIHGSPDEPICPSGLLRL